jgi:hypothetical protein
VIEEIQKRHATFLKTNNVTTVIVNAHKCRNPSMGNNCGDISHGGEAAINLARFQMYKDWTKGYSDDDLIMVTDVRDVYFQANPFPLLEPELSRGKDWFGFEEDIDAFHNTLGWHSGTNGLKVCVVCPPPPLPPPLSSLSLSRCYCYCYCYLSRTTATCLVLPVSHFARSKCSSCTFLFSDSFDQEQTC